MHLSGQPVVAGKRRLGRNGAAASGSGMFIAPRSGKLMGAAYLIWLGATLLLHSFRPVHWRLCLSHGCRLQPPCELILLPAWPTADGAKLAIPEVADGIIC